VLCVQVNRGGTIDITSNVKGADDVLRYLKYVTLHN
jgi:hypothetical protein